jgi:hypothetical protein
MIQVREFVSNSKVEERKKEERQGIIDADNYNYCICKIFCWTFRASHGLATVDCFYFLFGTGKKFLIEFYLHFRFLPNMFSLFPSLFPFADDALLATGTR